MKLSVEQITKVLTPFAPIAVYVFGSTASGRSRADSDVDIAFVPAKPCDPYEVIQAAQELASLAERGVDLVDLSSASAVMKAQVIGTGRRVFAGDARRVAEFEMYALSDYARSNEERREVLAAFAKPAYA